MGSGGQILVGSGSTWSSMTSGTTEDLQAVFALSTGEVYAVGAGGVVLTLSGGVWNKTTLTGKPKANGVWASSSKDVYVALDLGKVRHYDGSSWSQESVSPYGNSLGAVTGAGPGAMLLLAVLKAPYIFSPPAPGRRPRSRPDPGSA